MATPVQHQAATSYGAQGTPIVKVMPPPVVPNPARSPATTDIKYLIGQTWVNNSNNTAWMLSSKTTTTATWIALGSGATGGVVTLTGDSGGAISPAAGNINILGGTGVSVAGAGSTLTINLTGGGVAIDSFVPDAGTNPVVPDGTGSITMAGTASQITTTGGLNTLTFSLPAAITAPGSLTTTTSLAATTTVTAGTGITSTTGNIAATAGNVTAGAAVSATTTITAGTGVTSTTGNIVATAGAVNAGTSMTATAGDITATLGNVVVNGAAKHFSVHGGAVTDFIGQAVLVNGTVNVANTNIAATDRIFVTRSAKNASTAYGTFLTAITPSGSFDITSCKSDTTTETNDASTVDYVIIRQV